MIGAIAGDIIGSVYEFDPIKTKDFELFSGGSMFTDDTVLTVALAEAILEGTDYSIALKRWFREAACEDKSVILSSCVNGCTNIFLLLSICFRFTM